MTVIETIDFARDLLNEPLDSARTFPDDVSSGFFKDTTLLNYFNREQQIIQQELIQSFEHYFVTSTTIDIVNGTDEYTLTSGVIKIVRVEYIGHDIDNPVEIIPQSFNEKEFNHDYYSTVSGAGDVRAYSIKGDALVFRPRPKVSKASAVRYYYVQKLPDLSSGSSTSLIPEQFHEVLAWGIYKRALLMQEGNVEAVAAANSEYNRLIVSMRSWAENRQIQRPRQVKRRKYGRYR